MEDTSTAPTSVVTTKTQRRIERIPADPPLMIYANSAEVSISLFDLVLTLGQVQEADMEHLVIQERAKVYMSPQHALALLNVLTKHVDLYQQQFGPIQSGPVPSEPAPQP